MKSLEPNSLYIATQQIFHRRGSFHWALIITDSVGNATIYEWMELSSRPDVDQDLTLAEGFVKREYDAGCVPEEVDNQVILVAMLRIQGFQGLLAVVPPGEDDYNTSSWGELFTSSATIRENRLRGVTCRTWALKVLESLGGSGIIVRSDRVKDIETLVKDASTEVEDQLAEGNFEVLIKDI